MKTFKTPKGTELPFLNLKGKDYLQVMHRLVWFREEKSDWTIETEFLQLTDKVAIAKATVKDASGRIIATGTKKENMEHFADFTEKAESGAVGRALAFLGYGTSFAQELEEGHDRLADSPAPRKEGKPMPMPKDLKAKDMVKKAKPVEAVLEYKPTFGKYKGKDIYQANPAELADYVSWLEQGVRDSGKPIKPMVLEFIEHAIKIIEQAIDSEEPNEQT